MNIGVKFLMRSRLTNGKMSYVELIIKALQNLGGQAPYTKMYREIERITGVTLDDGLMAGIRRTIHDYSSDSDGYKGIADIFYSVQGKGYGVWGLR